MRIQLGLFLAVGAAATGVLGAQDYCNSNFRIPNADYNVDLSKLNKAFTIVQDQQGSPAIISTRVNINICDRLQRPENTEERDFCKDGSYICHRTVAVKDEKEIVLTVKDIAGDYQDDKLSPQFKALNPDQDLSQSGAQFSLVLNGGKVNNQAQSAQLTLECDTSQSRNEDAPAPTLVSYQNNVMSLTWKTVHACAFKPSEQPPPSSPPDENKGEEKKGMSGISVFFTLVFVLLGIYFVGGAIYNFKMYNARGLDLIPHRDFWLDLPYLIKDLISHVVDTIMSHRRGGGGYVSV
ncbi:autophagy-related protein 27 [Dichotomocladium elegans]|nr:autophagy-related protein 27 [Dichotomocladium elegans]